MKNNYYTTLKTACKGLVYSSIMALSIFTGFAYYGHEQQKIETKNNFPYGKLEQTITVMSTNIAACRGRPFSFWDLFPNPVTEWWQGGITSNGCKKLEQLIHENNVFIAGFQEMEQNEVRGENQPQLFSRNTSLKNYSFATNIAHTFARIWYLADGNAIFSKAPIENSIWIPLEEDKPFSWGTIFDSLVGTEGIQHVTINYNSYPINIINVHLSNEEFANQELEDGTILRERELEFRKVFEYAVRVTKFKPTIFICDCNSVSPAIRQKWFPEVDDKYQGENTWETALKIVEREGLVLDDAGVLSSTDLQGSYHGVVPTNELGQPSFRKDTGERIDFIMTMYDPKKNKVFPRILETRVIDDYLVSDHYPVVAKIEFVTNE